MKLDKRRGALLGAALLIALASYWFVRAGGPSHADVGATADHPDSTGLAAVAPRRFALPPNIPPEADSENQNLPIIDEIAVDKPEVCLGEENFVTVKAHTGNGTDPFLGIQLRDPTNGRYVLGGSRIPFRIDEPHARPLMVTVEGKSISRTLELPAVRVKDCVAPRQVKVEVRRTMNARDRVGFTAEVVEHPPASAGSTFEPLVPASYRWDFGDGEQQTTTAAQVEHSYEGRDQSTRQSSFLVTVTVADGRGQAAQGSAAVGFPNLAFGQLFFKNRVIISIGVKEADPLSGEHEKIWLYHGYARAVRLDSVTVSERIVENGAARESFQRSYAPQDLLGLTQLQPHQSGSVRDLTDMQPSAPNAVRHVVMKGTSADGREASGEFTLLPSRPVVSAQGASNAEADAPIPLSAVP